MLRSGARLRAVVGILLLAAVLSACGAPVVPGGKNQASQAAVVVANVNRNEGARD